MATPDVAVMGGGIFGLSVAWALTLRGARVRLVERRRIGAGASGGPTGALAPHTPDEWKPKKQFQFEALCMAADWWAGVEAASGLRVGYGRIGRLQPLADERAVALARARQESARALWQGATLWSVRADAEAAGWVPGSPTGLHVFDTLSARIAPAAACTALAAALTARGAMIEIGDTAPAGGPVVWATGWEGLEALARELGRPAGSGVKGQALSIGFDARDRAQIFVDGLHIVPHADGTVAIGSTSERYWTGPETTDAQLDALHARAVAACPALRDAPVLRRWAGVRPRALSRAPMLGPHPTRPGHFIANGGFKIGFGIAPRVGQIMADLVLDGAADIPEDFSVAASLR